MKKKKNVVPFSTEALQYGHKAHDKHDSSGSEKEKKTMEVMLVLK